MIDPAGLSDSPEAQKVRDACDFSTKITLEEAFNGTERRPRVYADGVFDLTHYGHALLFKQIKDMVPGVYTIAGVMSQEDTIKHKGKPVLTAEERTASMLHCRYVDEVVENGPWCVTFEFMDRMKIDFVAHDALPYHQTEEGDPYDKIRRAGRFLATKRTKSISTTDIIGRIVTELANNERRYTNGAANAAVQHGFNNC